MNIDRVFAALASRPRRMILAYLSETSMTAGEIAERFDMSKPALSKHLKLLESAGLVSSEKKGQYVHYRLSEDNLPVKLHCLLATVCPIGGPLKRESKAIALGKSKAASQDKSQTVSQDKSEAVPQQKRKTASHAKSKAANPDSSNISRAAKDKDAKGKISTKTNKALKPDQGSNQPDRQSGNKLQLELAIGAPSLPLSDH